MTQRRFLIDRVSEDDVLLLLSDGEGWWTRRDIAKALGVSKNTTLINLLEQMAANGQIQRAEGVTINRARVLLYRSTHNGY
jgi:prophage antirepressor-like protein